MDKCCNLMKQYVLKTEMGGKQRRLLILHPSEGIYTVYWDKLYLGKVQPVIEDDLGIRWKTQDETLSDCVQEIGAFIEDCDHKN